jgi:hypothetical protein
MEEFEICPAGGGPRRRTSERAVDRSADAILNIFSRQNRGAINEPVATPAHLRLSEEPVADCARYDRLIAEARRGAA